MLLVNECRFFIRQPLVQLSFLLMPLFAYMLTAGMSPDSAGATVQLQLNQMALLLLALPVVVAALSPIILLRDKSANMDELIGCTPLSNGHRWLLRYGALTLLTLALFILSFTVMALSYSISLGFELEFFYITMTNIVQLVLPSILFFAAIALCLTMLWHNAMLIYVGFTIFGIGYLVLASMTGSPILAGSSVISPTLYQLMMWGDPYGISAVLDKLNSPMPFSNIELLVNRLAYLLLSTILVFIALTMVTKEKTSRKKINTAHQPSTPSFLGETLAKTSLGQLFKVSFLTLIKNKINLVIITTWPLLIFNEVLSGINYAEPMTTLSANSIDALNRVAFDLLPVGGALMVALWSWMICSRDKQTNIAELIAATKTSNKSLILSQLMTLWSFVITLIILTFIGSSIAEIFAESQWILSHYLIQLALNLVPLLLLGTIFISFHHIFRTSLSAGLMMIAVLLVKFTPITTTLGLTHTLWNIADTPLQAPDNYWGYSASGSVYFPYIAVWLFASLSMLMIAIHRSHRGTGIDFKPHHNMPKRTLISLLLTAITAISLHITLISEKPLLSSDKREAWKAQYEKKYSQWQLESQPSVVHIDSHVDIYPDQQQANFSLKYTLENRTDNAIEQVLVGRYGNYHFDNIAIDGASLSMLDTALNQAVFTLSSALLPGEQRTMHAKVNFEQSQLWPHRSHQVVKEKFTYLRAIPLLPTVGYQSSYQLTDPQLRSNYDLPTVEQQLPSTFVTSEDETNAYTWATLSSVVSTKVGHHVIAQGKLVEQWQDKQRAYFKFQTGEPIRAIPSWVSVPFSATTQQANGITLNVYAPLKNEATQLHLDAMADTIAWFTKHVVPYRANQLHIISAPDDGPSGYALPQIMLVSDKLAFRATPTPNAGFDQRYRRAVHETAHQWFGHDIGNGTPLDRSFLIESLAKYVELVLIEQYQGPEAMQALVAYEQQRFDNANRNNYNAPQALIDATQTHDIYSRATLVFATLRQAIGDQPISDALKALWSAHAYPKTPATSIDFVHALKGKTLAKHHQLIDQLFLGLPLISSE